MQEEIKCPNCGGHKFDLEREGVYRCAYCGCLVKEKKEPEQPKEVVREVITRIEQSTPQKSVWRMSIFEVIEAWPKWTKMQKAEYISMLVLCMVFIFLIIQSF